MVGIATVLFQSATLPEHVSFDEKALVQGVPCTCRILVCIPQISPKYEVLRTRYSWEDALPESAQSIYGSDRT